MLAELDTDLFVDRRNIPFTLDKGIAHRAALGLIVLATDHTIEHEWRAMLTGIDGRRLLREPALELGLDHARDARRDGARHRLRDEAHPAGRAHRRRRLRLHVGRDGDRRRQGRGPRARGAAGHALHQPDRRRRRGACRRSKRAASRC